MKTFIVFLVGLLLGVVGASVAMFASAPKLMTQTRQSPVSLEETVARIEKAAAQDGWKVLGKRALHKSVKEHADLDVPPVQLIDLCEPHYAGKILSDDEARPVTVFMPCTVSVYETSDGKVWVTSTNAELLGTLFGGTVKEVMADQVAPVQKKFVDLATAKPESMTTEAPPSSPGEEPDEAEEPEQEPAEPGAAEAPDAPTEPEEPAGEGS